MKITTTTSYKLKFYVTYNEATEGGMNSDNFSISVDTLEEAVQLWDIAQQKKKYNNWVIECEVEKTIEKS